MSKIDNILFYASTNVKPPKKGLEKILENLPVTNNHNLRYISVMGVRLALPLGIVAIALIAFIAFSNAGKNSTPSQNQTVRELPASVTKENVDPALNQVDATIKGNMDEMDKDLQELDQESNSNSNDDLNNL